MFDHIKYILRHYSQMAIFEHVPTQTAYFIPSRYAQDFFGKQDWTLTYSIGSEAQQLQAEANNQSELWPDVYIFPSGNVNTVYCPKSFWKQYPKAYFLSRTRLKELIK